MSEKQVMERIAAYAQEQGVKLSYTHKLFYLNLLRYAKKHRARTDTGDYYVCLSTRDMSGIFHISFRMVTQSLKILSESGILLRQENKDKAFPREPSITILLKQFFS